MNTFLNYLIEANLCLLLGLLFYKLILEKETMFTFQRSFLLTTIIASVVVPLFHFQTGGGQIIPAVGDVIPVYWLPEFSVGQPELSASNAVVIPWNLIGTIYLVGLTLSAILMIVPLMRLYLIFRSKNISTHGSVKFIETNFPFSFSFFNYVFISSSDAGSEQERKQIIRHEFVHVRRFHSFDIIIMNIVQILFWFNPCVYHYRKIFVQLHEFEADARSVKTSEVDEYCSLLARIALNNAGISIANHFNNSLTVKRIQMMRTLKKNIKKWKLVASAMIVVLFFTVFACQDQIMDDVEKSTLTQTGQYPPEVQRDLDRFKVDLPGEKLSYIEGTSADMKKLLQHVPKELIVKEYSFKDKQGLLLKEQVAEMQLQTDDGVYTVVQEQPEYTGGYDKMVEYLRENLRYPAVAAEKKLEGVVYVQFVIDETGKIIDPGTIRGIEKSVDDEAVRVVSEMPNWIPGRQDGKNVKVRFVLPIRFNLD
jgi:TonB family protein